MSIATTKKDEYISHIRQTLTEMHDKSTHEDIYRIMDAIANNEPALACLDNLVGKVNRLSKDNFGLRSTNAHLKEKTQRMWR